MSLLDDPEPVSERQMLINDVKHRIFALMFDVATAETDIKRQQEVIGRMAEQRAAQMKALARWELVLEAIEADEDFDARMAEAEKQFEAGQGIRYRVDPETNDLVRVEK